MKQFFIALLLGLLLVSSTPQPAASAPLVDCRVVAGQQTRVICTAAGAVVLNTVVNVPTPAPIIIPGPTRTVTIRPQPQPAETVTKNVPTPGATVTVREPQRTVTASPRPTPPRPSQLPEESDSSDSGQTGLDRGRIDPSDKDEGGFFGILPSPEEVVRGTISILLLVGLILLALWGGYYLGYKDKEKKERNFLRALQNQLLRKDR